MAGAEVGFPLEVELAGGGISVVVALFVAEVSFYEGFDLGGADGGEEEEWE